MTPTTHSRGDNGGRVPKDILQGLAEKMGTADSKEFREQAQNVWAMLDDLHARDGHEYKSFIQDQMKQSVEHMNKSVSSAKYFTPAKGFVVKAVASRLSCKTSCSKIFINVVHHDAIERPKEANGRLVQDDTVNMDDLHVPLLVSNIRCVLDNKEHDVSAVDVVVHPWCIKMAEKKISFKYKLAELALEWVQKEKDVEIQKEWKILKATYKGGSGNQHADVFPLHVDQDVGSQGKGTEESAQKYSKTKSNVIRSPADLLKNINSAKSSDNEAFRLHTTNCTEKPLVEEVVVEEVVDTPCQPHSTNNSKIKVVPLKSQMKGFLNKHKGRKPLYATVHSGDEYGSTGGSFTKFMSKCAVVDTATMLPNNSFPKEATGSQMIKAAKGQTIDTKSGHADGTFDFEFNQLMRHVDPAFAESFEEQQKVDYDEMKETLAELAEAMGKNL